MTVFLDALETARNSASYIYVNRRSIIPIKVIGSSDFDTASIISSSTSFTRASSVFFSINGWQLAKMKKSILDMSLP